VDAEHATVTHAMLASQRFIVITCHGKQRWMPQILLAGTTQ
jgi:hypothetical protein